MYDMQLYAIFDTGTQDELDISISEFHLESGFYRVIYIHPIHNLPMLLWILRYSIYVSADVFLLNDA